MLYGFLRGMLFDHILKSEKSWKSRSAIYLSFLKRFLQLPRTFHRFSKAIASSSFTNLTIVVSLQKLSYVAQNEKYL